MQMHTMYLYSLSTDKNVYLDLWGFFFVTSSVIVYGLFFAFFFFLMFVSTGWTIPSGLISLQNISVGSGAGI